MQKKLVCFCVSLLILCGCATLTGSYPDWYLNPPENSHSSLYGVGEGYDLNSATKLALKNISEKIVVTLSSESSIYQAESTAGYVEDAEYSIDEKTEEITFNNYKTLKTHALGGRFFALVEVNKQELIRNQKKELDKVEDEIDELDKSSKRKNSLVRMAALTSIRKEIPKAETRVKVLDSLNPSFNDQAYWNKYSDFNREYTKLMNDIQFYIKTNDRFDKKAGSVFKKYLNQKGIKVADKFSTDLVILDIYSTVSTQKIYGSYMSKAKLHFSLIARGRTVKSNSLDLKGNSVINREEAKNSAIKQLDEKISEEGIFKIFRLE